MGIYLNPDNTDFQEALNSQIYVDKSELISITNDIIRTEQKHVCISRPRRFGKSMAANMLTAYYSRGCDSGKLFQNLKISKSDSYEKHLNRYNVIRLNMTDFLSRGNTMQEMLDYLRRRLLHELRKSFQDVDCFDWNDLISVLEEVFDEKQIPFVFIIDEWDCIFRVHKHNSDAQTTYLNFLRDLLKNKSYVALTYMTGILPIKKYGEHSALNMFTEVSMTNVRECAEFTGFTETEVRSLCEQYNMPFEETKRWYDGYELRGVSVYNPRSVVMSMTGGYFSNYWTSTETYEALKVYIEMNFDGLREKIVRMIASESVKVNAGKFQNDMTTFNSADDVLTLLIHLGYLTYDFDTKTTWIPNAEVQQEFINSIEDGGWEHIMHSIKLSDELLEATLQGDTERAAEIIEQVHDENTSILQYNNENSLSCILSLAYYSSKKKYTIHRELAGGKGFADLVFIPRKECSDPAMIVELKWNQSAETAIDQIKRKEYVKCLKDYSGDILLVGINYDKEAPDGAKKHRCLIEKLRKENT